MAQGSEVLIHTNPVIVDCLLQVVACMAEEAHANTAKQQERWRSWYNEQVCFWTGTGTTAAVRCQ
jgi:hypothetical protein